MVLGIEVGFIRGRWCLGFFPRLVARCFYIIKAGLVSPLNLANTWHL